MAVMSKLSPSTNANAPTASLVTGGDKNKNKTSMAAYAYTKQTTQMQLSSPSTTSINGVGEVEDDGHELILGLGNISTEASIMATLDKPSYHGHGAATAVMKTSSSEDEAEAAMGASKYTTPTRRHGIAVRALKVVLASAAVSGAIWGLTSPGAKRSVIKRAANTSTKTSKSPVVKQAKSKVGKEVKVEGVPVKVKGTGSIESLFDSWPSDGLDEKDSLRVAVNGVQQTLQQNLCEANKDLQDCKVVAILDPTRRQLGGRSRNLPQSPPIVTNWTISFIIQCTGTCDDEVAQAQAAAEAIAALRTQFNSLSNDEYRAGYLAALALLPSAPSGAETYWSNVSFGLQPLGDSISGEVAVDPTLPFDLPVIEAAGYTLVGQGYALDAVGSYYCFFGHNNRVVSTPEQCATVCQGQPASTCYADANLIFRGFLFQYDKYVTCFCEFDCDHTSTTIPASCDSFYDTEYWQTDTRDNVDGSGPMAGSDFDNTDIYAFSN